MTLDIGKFLKTTAELGAAYHRRQKRARTKAQPSTQACSYCGAPGQRIGTRCEYCQVAVSR
jgi:hypothetical protein